MSTSSIFKLLASTFNSPSYMISFKVKYEDMVWNKVRSTNKKADKNSIGLLRQVTEDKKFETLPLAKEQTFNVLMLKHNYNIEAQQMGKPTAAFILIEAMLNINIFVNDAKFENHKAATTFDKSKV